MSTGSALYQFLTGGLVCLAAAAFVINTAAVAAPATYYVSPQGSDAWSGRRSTPNRARTDGPFATLQGAQQALRTLRTHEPLPPSGITVVVRAGVYHQRETFELSRDDSGTAESPVVWCAAPGEEVRLTGGPTLPPEVFTPVTDERILQRLDPTARPHVLQASLAALGIPSPRPFPDTFRGAPPMPELFFNDRPMALARWPNEGWATIARIVEPGARPRDGDSSGRPGIFEYSGEQPARWQVEAGVWLQGYWCYDWYEETIRVQAIDRASRQITLAAPHLYSLMQGNPSPRRYRALNVLEELDSPGEYYLDPETGLFFFWPPAAMAGARIVLSTLETPVLALRDASHVTVRGFTVECCRGTGIEVSGGAGNRIEACRVRNTGRLGIQVAGGSRHRIEACDLYDTGTGGLVLSGGDRRTLTPAGHHALNNHIWRYSRHQFTYANAILFEGVGSRAAHNLIHDAPHQAVAVHGNDHLFEYNVVHHVCLETDDCGAFYKGRNPSCRGNVIRYNFWHHIGSPMGHGNAAVYFDDGDGGDTVFGNVFYRCGEPGRGPFGTIFSHGGHDNLAQNNLLIDCKRALGSAPWEEARWRDALSGGQGCDWHIRLLQEVDITKPPYTTRYPELQGFLDPPPGQPRLNRAVRNVMVRCGEVSNGNWQCDPQDNWVTDRDPGFVDAAAGDFRLRPDAEVFTRLPGFQPIPFERMGLYVDDLRPQLPEEAWR